MKNDKRTPARFSLVLGAIFWIGLQFYHPPSPLQADWGQAILAFAVLICVPIVLRHLRLREAFQNSDISNLSVQLLEIAMRYQFPAAASFAIGMTRPEGAYACLFALPWLLVTAIIALDGLLRFGAYLFSSAPMFVIGFGEMYLLVGSFWGILDRWGVTPLDFDPIIVALTAIHFHFAGFLLPIVTAQAMELLPGRLARFFGVLIIFSMPLVAAGIICTRLNGPLFVEAIVAVVMSASGLGVAAIHIKLFATKGIHLLERIAFLLASLLLAIGMCLSILYGLRVYLPVPMLNIPWMRALHGTANFLALTILTFTLPLGDRKNPS